MTGARGAARALAAAVALLSPAPGRPGEGAPERAPRTARADLLLFELDLDAGAASRRLPLAADAIAAPLAAHGFDGIVLRTPVQVDEPAAAALRARFEAAGLAVWQLPASERAGTHDPGWPALEPLLLPAGDGAAARLARPLLRPAVRDLHWHAPGSGAPRDPNDARFLSERLLETTEPGLRVAQWQLDLESFGRATAPARAALAAQSRLASAWAAWLDGDHPELVAPLHNQAGARSVVPSPAAWRDDVAWLELEEWFGSRGAGGELLAARLLEGDAPPRPLTELLAPVAGTDVDGAAGGAPASDGVATRAELDWIEAQLQSRLEGARALALSLTDSGRPGVPASAGVAAAGDAAPATARADLWRAGYASESRARAAERRELHPWRVHRRTWRLDSPAARPAAAPHELRAARLDDPRLEPFARELRAALRGGPHDLAERIHVAPGTRVTLTTRLALRDPRLARLDLAAAAERTVRVNGAPVVERFPAGAGDLRATLVLPAGSSEVVLELVLDGSSPALDVALDLLPQRTGGQVLPAASASRVNEPLVRLGDPGALDGTSIALLAGRAAAGDGDAFFPFDLDSAALYDLWLHVLTPAERGTLELTSDGSPPLAVALPAGARWTWIRVPEPFAWLEGRHSLRVRLLSPATRLGQLALLRSDTVFPRAPAGDAPLAATAWRFDPLGAGIVVDLPPLAPGELYGRAFELEKSGSYRLHAWLRGSEPLAAGQHAELELTAASTRIRLVLPAGAPTEEWVALGEVTLTAGERVELRARGAGALARVALTR